MSMPEISNELPIEVARLRKTFAAKIALADFSLTLEPGQIFGAVGANGGGKTTALRLLAGLLPADSGEGRVLGIDLRAHPSRLRECVGYMTQHHSLYQDFTVAENLLARARVYGVPDPRTRVDEILRRFGLGRFARERVGRLSGGWKRRAQFAATVLPEPRLLLLDEPTAGLDLETSRRLWESVIELADGGVAVVVSTHDLVEAARCHALGVFVEGEVIARGTLEEIVSQSAAHVVRVKASHFNENELPGLIFVRSAARHQDLVFRGEPPPATLARLEAQIVEPTLEDAMSIFVHPQTEEHA